VISKVGFPYAERFAVDEFDKRIDGIGMVNIDLLQIMDIRC
jgi:hypothetical protein